LINFCFSFVVQVCFSLANSSSFLHIIFYTLHLCCNYSFLLLLKAYSQLGFQKMEKRF
jgi:hypothetical protein